MRGRWDGIRGYRYGKNPGRYGCVDPNYLSTSKSQTTYSHSAGRINGVKELMNVRVDSSTLVHPK